MKILNIRRGYTTNSSSSSEWMSPEELERLLREGRSPSGSKLSEESSSANISKNHNPQNDGRFQQNASILAGILTGVLSLFLLDRILRSIFKKKKGKQDVR